MSSDFNDFFYYDESSPSCLRWKVSIFSGKLHNIPMTSPGEVAGCLSGDGYYRVGLNGKSYLCHRLLFTMLVGPLLRSDDIDHEDRNRSNNKVSNLRKVTRRINTRNKSPNTNNVSGVVGVYKRTTHKGKYFLWVAETRDMLGKKITKAFSIQKYGNDEAFRLACEYHLAMIAELNAQGAGYTERHGK